jgi:tyrosinase
MSVFSLTTAIDLIPFPSGQHTVWKSPQIKKASTFNYKNPPFSEIGINPPFERSVPELHLYARQAISSFASEPGQASPSVFLDELSQRLGISIPKYDNPSDLIPALENVLPDWRIRVSIKKFEIAGSFSVFIFLGGLPADPAQWLYSPTFVGTFDVFSNENPETCSNCIKHRDSDIDGFVHLNSSILKQSGQIALDEKHVLPYLEKLSWGVQKVCCTSIFITALDIFCASGQ